MLYVKPMAVSGYKPGRMVLMYELKRLVGADARIGY